MESTGTIKIDQLRINIPYDLVDAVTSINTDVPKEVQIIDRIFSLSRIFNDGFESYGHNGYTSSYNFGMDQQSRKISIMWNSDRKDMGILVDFTATGKTTYEDLANLYGIKVDWQQLINKVCELYRGHIARIDIATDLINYGFSVNEINKSLLSKRYVFLNSIGNRIDSKRYKTIGKLDEIETLYVGSRKSDAFLRIYNKKTEQMRTNGFYRNIAINCKDWIRVEAEFKHRLAKRIGKYISAFKGTDIYPYLLGIVLERWSLVVEHES